MYYAKYSYIHTHSSPFILSLQLSGGSRVENGSFRCTASAPPSLPAPFGTCMSRKPEGGREGGGRDQKEWATCVCTRQVTGQLLSRLQRQSTVSQGEEPIYPFTRRT